MPPFKLELDNTVVAKFYSNHVCRLLSLSFELLCNFFSHLAIVKFLGVIEKVVTNCAVDKLVFKVIATQKRLWQIIKFRYIFAATLSLSSLFRIIYSHRYAGNEQERNIRARFLVCHQVFISIGFAVVYPWYLWLCFLKNF